MPNSTGRLQEQEEEAVDEIDIEDQHDMNQKEDEAELKDLEYVRDEETAKKVGKLPDDRQSDKESPDQQGLEPEGDNVHEDDNEGKDEPEQERLDAGDDNGDEKNSPEIENNAMVEEATS